MFDKPTTDFIAIRHRRLDILQVLWYFERRGD